MIADAKRGDIGSTARAYASAYLEPARAEPPLADAMTVNPYLGRDSLEPFIAACRREGAGIFCLVKTSNAGGADIQDLALSDGTPLWQHVASLVAEWGEELVGERGLSSVGAVVGATHPARGRRGAAAAAAGRPAPARRRRAGRDARPTSRGVHERAGERARHRVALGASTRSASTDDDWRAAAAAEAARLEERGLGRLGLVRLDGAQKRGGTRSRSRSCSLVTAPRSSSAARSSG